jgi:DNA primase
VSVPTGLAEESQRGAALLAEILRMVRAQPDLSCAGLLERFRERPEGPHLQQLLTEELLLEAEPAAREFADCLARIMARGRDQRLAELVEKAAAGPLSEAEREELRGIRRSED